MEEEEEEEEELHTDTASYVSLEEIVGKLGRRLDEVDNKMSRQLEDILQKIDHVDTHVDEIHSVHLRIKQDTEYKDLYRPSPTAIAMMRNTPLIGTPNEPSNTPVLNRVHEEEDNTSDEEVSLLNFICCSCFHC